MYSLLLSQPLTTVGLASCLNLLCLHLFHMIETFGLDKVNILNAHICSVLRVSTRKDHSSYQLKLNFVHNFTFEMSLYFLD